MKRPHSATGRLPRAQHLVSDVAIPIMAMVLDDNSRRRHLTVLDHHRPLPFPWLSIDAK